tara:strand:+ start:99 stop:878 length:780 start_codon:yes stop_codon:yes gene_type:complete
MTYHKVSFWSGKHTYYCSECDAEFADIENEAKVCEQSHYCDFSEKELFFRLEEHITHLTDTKATVDEKVVIGEEKLDMGIFGETSINKYDTRTRHLPENQVKKAVLKAPLGFAEKEINRRMSIPESAEEIFPLLIGKYRSGKNIDIIKRILEKIDAKDVGIKFEEYEMFQEAEEWFSSHQLFEEAKKVRNELRVNVEQTVVEGDQITKTEIKDSVLNRSNINSGGDDKFAKLKELKEMFDSGFISNEEMEEMKKDIMGK